MAYVATNPVPAFRFVCLGCGKRDQSNTERGCIADTNGEPFKAYYHVACLPPVQEEKS
jgi:hypothetical protein